MEQDPDFDLVRLLRNRDEQGLLELDKRYARQIYGLIYKMIHNEDQAHLILQDTFLKIWYKIEQYQRSKGRFLTWIFSIARNTTLDWLRSKDHKNQTRVSYVGHEYRIEPIVEGIHPDRIGIKEMTNKLEEKYRMIIELAYFNGYTLADIARENDIPLATVKSRARKAIVLMRELIVEK